MFPVCALFSTRGVFPIFSCLLYLKVLPFSVLLRSFLLPLFLFLYSFPVSVFPQPQVSCFPSFKKLGEFPVFSCLLYLKIFSFFSTLSPFLLLVLILTPIFYFFASLFYKYLSHSESLFKSESAEIFCCNVYFPAVV
jgi:hypothetical protein